MEKYCKIQSLFKRDMANRGAFTEEWAVPEFEYLKDNEWLWDEKIDGTNIRVCWDWNEVSLGGRTDNAQIPVTLVKLLNETFTWEKLDEVFERKEGDTTVTLFGEGCGKKIQKGGENYCKDGVKFLLFDVKIGPWWLQREAVHEIANKLSIEAAPYITCGTLAEAIEFTKPGFHSCLGPFPAEGLVLRPKLELTNRAGHRIIGKIKTKDFR